MFRRLKRYIPVFGTEVFLAHNLQELAAYQPKVPIEIEKLSEENVQEILEVKRLNLDRMRVRLKRGDSCLISRLENKVASYHWNQFTGAHKIQQAGMSVDVHSDDTYIYHVRVADWAQGKGISTALYRALLIEAKELGKKRALIYTDKTNVGNLKSLGRLGFEEIFRFGYVQFRGKFYSFTNIAKKIESSRER